MQHKLNELILAALVTAFWSMQASAQFLPRGITQVTDNLYWAHQDSHRTVLLVTEDGVMMTDPISTEFSLWLKDEIQARFGVPVRYVLYSHHHWDHASGGAVFEDTATFVGHENMLHNLALPPVDTPLPGHAAALDANGNGQLERDETEGEMLSLFELFDANGDGSLSGAEIERGAVGDVRPPDMTFRDQMTVRLGGEEAQLFHVGRMLHTDAMSAIVFPGESAVFVVDFITTGRLPYVDYFTGFAENGVPPEDLDSWLNAIRVVEMLGVDIVTPGHGSVGTIADVREHRHYIEDLRDSVAAAVARGESMEEVQRSVTLSEYSHLFNYDDWRSTQVEAMYRMTTQ
jgi:glyoxylase-like metal-dependent hydrolase (beta-lactamase superfamily II)